VASLLNSLRSVGGRGCSRRTRALTYFKRADYFDRLKHSLWPSRLLKSTPGQILRLLRQRDRTVDELAARLRLTDNAIRAHLVNLQHDGFVVQSGTRPGLRKPHALYAVTLAVEQLFPKSYARLLDLVLSTIRRRLPKRDLRHAMRQVGRKIAVGKALKPSGRTRRERIDAAVRFLSELGGEPTFEQLNGTGIIRGRRCPLAAVTANHPEACLIAESLLSKIIGTRVKERCRRGPEPSCCFEISSKCKARCRAN
jgi:predicted ArsR family transcriptional regulator